MNKISEAQLKAEEERKKRELINSIIISIYENSTPATRTISTLLGIVATKSLQIPVSRVDHYTGTTERIEDGSFQFSRYETDIGGVKISRDSYQEIMELLGAL